MPARTSTVFTFIFFFLLPGFSAWPREPIAWVFTDYSPANFVIGENSYSGYLYDIVIEAFEHRMGVPVEVTILPWTRCQRLVEMGIYDMFVTIPTPERLEYAVPTQSSIWVKRRILYTYAYHPRMEKILSVRSLEDIREGGFTVVTYIGNDWAKTVLEEMGIPVLYASTVETMYRMLERKRADLIIENEVIAGESIRDLGLGDGIVAADVVVSENGFHILIGRHSAFLPEMDRLDDVVDEMRRDGTIDAILAKYGLRPIG